MEDENKIEEFKNHKQGLSYVHFETIRNPAGKKIGQKCIQHFETKKGKIEASLWHKQALSLIVKYQEEEILTALMVYCKDRLAWLKDASYDEVLKESLDLHIRRIFECKDWLGYEEFKNYL